ncbi:non-oxidative hydroxyarylic acid decarboxylases subunit D [Saccharopolyspora rosea]|uniref:Non-oxidative hydroxyarylic acid decarboxylases subunit D n=1 Tax=Saccharopolyspora rosea TaxID=524884 RepID=A0ABW3FTI7_9PSEU|nr:non-oxidative hydroxyarylic acid decarboxylases subunit D [Saccharopolyspora rosea]
MICPRCAWEDVTTLAVSPVAGVWEVYQCARCLYTWRSTEPERRTSRDAYPEAFRMTQADIDAAPQVPTVPPLIREGA